MLPVWSGLSKFLQVPALWLKTQFLRSAVPKSLSSWVLWKMSRTSVFGAPRDSPRFSANPPAERIFGGFHFTRPCREMPANGKRWFSLYADHPAILRDSLGNGSIFGLGKSGRGLSVSEKMVCFAVFGRNF